MDVQKKLQEIYAREQRGKGQPVAGTGGTDYCTCPNKNCELYKKLIAHKRGVPCNVMKCKSCGQPLTGVGTIGTKLKVGESSFLDSYLEKL